MYKLQWKAEAPNTSNTSGLAWHLRSTNSSAAADLVSGDLLAPQQSWEFVATPNVGGFMLTLESNRALGQVRPEGHITIRSVSMEREQ